MVNGRQETKKRKRWKFQRSSLIVQHFFSSIIFAWEFICWNEPENVQIQIKNRERTSSRNVMQKMKEKKSWSCENDCRVFLQFHFSDYFSFFYSALANELLTSKSRLSKFQMITVTIMKQKRGDEKQNSESKRIKMRRQIVTMEIIKSS